MGNSISIWQLIARVLNKEATSEEEARLNQLLQEDEALQQQFDLLTRIWKEKHEHVEFKDQSKVQSAILRIINKADNEGKIFKISASRNRFKKRIIWVAAASLVLLLSIRWLWSASDSAGANTKLEAIEAKNGSRSRSLLPDGTTVWLNAGSKLTYENEFSGSTREVTLEGEAFFDVVKQPDHPFIVHTAGIDIKVLGTAFNVKSYSEDKAVETTLYRGSVKVFREDETEQKAIQLKPNEKLILLKRTAIKEENLSDNKPEIPTVKNTAPATFTIAKIDSTKLESERFETAWIYSRLEFRGDNFEDLARKLERWYNVTVTFTDEKVKQLNFNGSFENENVEQAFAALKSALPFDYIIKGHEIFVGSLSN